MVAALLLPGAAAAAGPKRVVVKQAAAKCAALAGVEVKESQIALRTQGAVVDTATLTAPDVASGRPEFCLVRGHVRGHDPDAPPINFQVNLPTRWNVKSVQFGGGGFNGVLITGLGALPGSAPATNAPVPAINRGYATFGGDGGTAVGSRPAGSFGLNAEALANYAGESVKRTRDASIAIVKRYYRKRPALQYYAGSSKGGHEGLVAAQRYAKDYDGIIAYYPANQNQAMVLTWHHLWQQAYGRPGGYLNPAKQRLVVNAVYATCDGLDGATDGIVANVAACDATFDVGTLRCADGADTGDDCLSDTQIGTLDAAATPFQFAFPLAYGLTTLGKFPIYQGADPAGVWLDTAGTGAATSYNGFVQPVLRYFILQQPDASTAGFDYRDHEARVKAISWAYDSTDPDIDRYAGRGGKLILVQGTLDMLVPHSTTTQYYERLAARYGMRVREFVRYFIAPGYAHGNGPFNVSWDSLTALERWREDGVAPADQVAFDGNAATKDRSRPLCEYPAWPKYVAGDVDEASSFTCAVGPAA